MDSWANQIKLQTFIEVKSVFMLKIGMLLEQTFKTINIDSSFSCKSFSKNLIFLFKFINLEIVSVYKILDIPFSPCLGMDRHVIQ